MKVFLFLLLALIFQFTDLLGSAAVINPALGIISGLEEEMERCISHLRFITDSKLSLEAEFCKKLFINASVVISLEEYLRELDLFLLATSIKIQNTASSDLS